MKIKQCPICGEEKLLPLITIPNIPTLINVLKENESQAKEAICGTQSLVQCDCCGFVFNNCFDSELLKYEEGYHSERGVSQYFHKYMKRVIEQINAAKDIKGKNVLEVACGSGEFLQEIALQGALQCIGIDPSLNTGGSGQTIQFQREYFSRTYVDKLDKKIDILINRHMIEHILNPLEMLLLFSETLTEGGLLYLECPRLDWILEKRVFYDLLYEHCAYFSDDFMKRLLNATGFSIISTELTYGGQFFSICACKDKGKTRIDPENDKHKEHKREEFLEMERTYHRVQENFPQQIREISSDGIWLWGASGKGVMCSNLLNSSCIQGFIDKNPFKQGKFMPGSGCRIIAPEEIPHFGVQVIVVENEMYLDEVIEEVKNIDNHIQVKDLNQFLGLNVAY